MSRYSVTDSPLLDKLISCLLAVTSRATTFEIIYQLRASRGSVVVQARFQANSVVNELRLRVRCSCYCRIRKSFIYRSSGLSVHYHKQVFCMCWGSILCALIIISFFLIFTVTIISNFLIDNYMMIVTLVLLEFIICPYPPWLWFKIYQQYAWLGINDPLSQNKII